MESFVRASAAVAVLDLKRILLGRRAVPLLVLGGVPVLLSTLIASLAPPHVLVGRFVEQYAAMFQVLVLSGTLFFGVAVTFVGLLRGEMLDKSLHYLLLSPVRREALAAGKYAAGFVATALTFGASTVLSYVILLWGVGGPGRERLFSAQGVAALGAYAAASVLACAAYGGLFLALGLLGKNPMVFAAVVWGIERISVVFPPVLKWPLPSYHLESLLPVHLSKGPFALLVGPAPWWAAVLVLLAFGVLFAAGASLGARRVEIRYGGE